MNDCCSGYCDGNTCEACVAKGGGCNFPSDCCSGNCGGGTCN
jgi:hypothetical protein